MPKNSLLPSEWLENFNNAIMQRDIESIALFLNSLPDFETPDQLRDCLALTMEAEAFLCDMQKILTKKRQSLQTRFSL